MSNILIYHNPACSNSRQALALIRQAGLEPTVIEYLNTPFTKEALRGLLAATGQPVRELLRTKEARFAELGLDDPSLDDDALLEAVVSNPVLLNRPLVVTPLGTALCRPPERVLSLLQPRATTD